MKISEYRQFEYGCHDTQELLTLLIVCPEELTFDERAEADKHLGRCSKCRQDYEGMKLASDMLTANSDYLRNSGVFGDIESDRLPIEMSHERSMEIRFQARLERAGIRRKRRERKQRIAKVKRIIRPISAVAACMLIVLSLWWAIGSLQSDRSTKSKPIVAKPYTSSVKIELVSDTTIEVIQFGQLVAATNELKTLRINGNREMTLNTGTQLSIVPYNLGCLVKLDKGEIYTHVEHDGNPFIIETSYGRAVITGTTFNIKADDTQMELVVTEGTVSFENDKGFVNVEAGYKSQMTINSLPTTPIICDTDSIIAWNTPPEAEPIVSRCVLHEIDLPITQEAPILENIDYDTWVNENRDWFKRQFPEIFQIKEALAKDGIEVGYPHLLLRSNELWRFVYPPTSSKRCIEPAALALEQIASLYAKNRQWLANAVGTVNLATDTASSPDIAATNVEMFNKWHTDFEQARQSGKLTYSNLILDSLHASVYLAKTRTLLWLSATKNNEDDKILNLLEEQITKANEMTVQVFELINCDENKCMSRSPEIIVNIEENISAIAGIEKEVQSK